MRPPTVQSQELALKLLSHKKLAAFSIEDYVEKLHQESGEDFSYLIQVTRAMLSFMEGASHLALKKVALSSLQHGLIIMDKLCLHAVTRERLQQLKLQSQVDLVNDLCDPLFTDMISILFGLDIPDRADFLALIDKAAAITEPLLPIRRLKEVQNAFLTLRDMIGGQWRTLRPGILSAMQQHGDGLGQEELLILMATLVIASRTTTETLAGVMLENSGKDGCRHGLMGDPQWVEEHIEGMIRLCASTEYLTRVAKESVQIGDLPLAAAGQVFIHAPSANRDPSYYPDNHFSGLERSKHCRHIAFGGGSHRCPGANLAKVTLSAVIPIIYSTLERIDIDPKAVRYKNSTFAKRPASIPAYVC
ncbi:Cytochrome P450 [Hahella chejuensis KCTC 2396]|uniref:Cytochrome P450 n=1 Tax=Hahella chejuensis (strain KCTC 2396) TaxID=349521 RepID=Q2SG84_HAHCH|nr:cytochrome P450 [Hahella chejuensis]ABC30340.1 Cytochrome P450 [Hahella chejuensis KCTC 2396]